MAVWVIDPVQYAPTKVPKAMPAGPAPLKSVALAQAPAKEAAIDTMLVVQVLAHSKFVGSGKH